MTSTFITHVVNIRNMAVLVLAFCSLALAQEPIPKKGSCPNGYYTSGNYCVPSGTRSNPAIAKTGPCPNGYYMSGNYCVATDKNRRIAVPKNGPCPTGYYTSGSYCVSTAKPE
jgi:hypothetical protein